MTLAITIAVFAAALFTIWVAWRRTDPVQKFKRQLRRMSELEKHLRRWEDDQK